MEKTKQELILETDVAQDKLKELNTTFKQAYADLIIEERYTQRRKLSGDKTVRQVNQMGQATETDIGKYLMSIQDTKITIETKLDILTDLICTTSKT